MPRTPLRLFTFGALLAAFMMVAVTSAYGASPTLSQVKPASGSRFTGGFAVSFSASDPDGVNGAAARVTVGTKTYTPGVNYAGWWEGDGCDSWWVDDTRTAWFNLNVPDPGPGVLAVMIAVPDARGEVTTTTFTITRTADVTFSEPSPKPGARLKSATDLALLVSGPVISTSSAVVTVDGATVPSTCQMIGTGAAIVTASYPFLPGGHTVSIAVGDGTSAPPATTTWTFSVNSAASPPLVGTATPVEGSIVQSAFKLNYHVTDSNGVNGAGARVLVDGRKLYSGITSYPGYWTGDGCDTWWQEDRTSADIDFAIPNLSPGPHTFRLEVSDDTGDDVVTTTTLLRSSELTASGQTPTNESRNAAVDRVSVSLGGAAIDPATVSMTIDGALVPAVFTPAAVGGAVSYGAPLAEGRHTIRVSAADALGSPPYVEQWSFVVDSTAPRVSSLLPSADATVTLADSGIDVRVEEADAIDTSTVRLTLDGSLLAHAFTASPTGGVIRWNGIFSEGAHTATLVARDLAGNEASRTWSFFVANPPTFGAVVPTAIVGEATLITAEVSDMNAELDPAVHVTLDGAEVSATLVATGTKRGRVEASVAGLANGSHTIVARVRDSAQNEVSKSWSFTCDTLPPTVSAKTPASGAVLGSHTVPVSATLTDVVGMDPATAKGWIDGTPVSVSAYNDSYWDGSGCDAWEVSVPQTLFVRGNYQLHDGSHVFRVAATDYLGHAASSEWSFDVREYPKVSGVSPAAGLHTKQSSIALSANVTDYDGVSTTGVEWRRSGETDWRALASTFSDGVVRATFDVPAGEQGYEFRFTAEDTGGLRTTATTSVYVDVSGPVVDAGTFLPAGGATLTNHLVTFRGHFTDSSTIDPALLRVVIDGSPVSASAYHDTQWVGSGCDAWEEEIPGTLWFSGTAPLHDGPHTIRAVATDVFGFEAAREWSFTVQEKPSVTQLVPAPKGRSTATSMTVSAKVTDFDGIAETSVEWREANSGSTPGTWAPLAASYDDGTNRLSAHFAFPRADVRYEFRFTGTDSGGLSTSSITDVFASSSAKQISASLDCSGCHATIAKTHPMSDCTACHGDPRGPCSCHGWASHGTDLLQSATVWDHGGTSTGRTCVDCHSHTADVTAQQHSSAVEGSCAACHKNALTAEHATKTVNGSAFTCETCHKSTSSPVKAAIAAGDASCPACHDTYHTDLLAKHTAPPSTACQSAGCHAPGSVDDFHATYVGEGSRHPNYADSCSLCHANESATRIPSTATADCVSCHPDRAVDHGYDPAKHEATLGRGTIRVFDTDHDYDGQGPAFSNVECGLCHTSAIAPIHSTRCATCHPSPKNTYTSWSGSCSQGGCHTVYHQRSGTAHDALIAGNCANCHDGACRSCHQAPDPEDTNRLVTTCDVRDAYQGAASITFSASVGGKVPVGAIYYRLDGGSPQLGRSLRVTSPGSHELEFWSVDQFGRIESPKTASFAIGADVTPPQSTLQAGTYASGPFFTASFTATDDVSDIAHQYYRIDSGSPSEYFGVWPAFTEGPHTIEYWSEDSAGNTEEPKMKNIIFDWTPPTVTSDAVAMYPVSGATIEISALDSPIDGSGVGSVYYRLDGGAVQSGDAITKVVVTKPYAHTLEYWATDNAGNSSAHSTANFRVDSGTGTITLKWDAPPGSLAEYTIRDPSGAVVAHVWSSSIPDWSGWYTVTVPVAQGAYSWRVHWYDSDAEVEGFTSGSAVIGTPGAAYEAWY